MKEHWDNNELQFPRVIEEAQAAGAFTEEVMTTMCESMDLSRVDLESLLERAQIIWDAIKDGTSFLLVDKYAKVAWTTHDVQGHAADTCNMELTDGDAQAFLLSNQGQITSDMISRGYESIETLLDTWEPHRPT